MNEQMNRFFWIAILFFNCFLFLLNAQQPAKDLQYFESKYPEESAVETMRRQTLQILIIDGKPEIYTEKYLETIILTDRVTSFANEKLYYSPDNPIVELEAYSLIPQGKKYKKVDVKDFTHISDFSNHIFFDDSKACSFVYPSLTKGCKTVYRVRQKHSDPFFVPPMYCSKIYAVEKSEIIIEYDRSIDMLFNEFAIDENNLKREIIENEQTNLIKNELNNIPAIKIFEDNVESILRYIPRIIPRIARYRVNDSENPVEVLATLDDLYKLYSSWVRKIDRSNDSILQPLADSITRPYNTEFEKVSAIYYWVQHNIRYVAFSDGDKGYIPDNAASVFNKRYGDCKGMSNLMHVLLDQAGIRSHLTWVGTKMLPYKYTEIASPATDNHMILCYFDETDKPFILDATIEFQSIFSAPPHIQGKECLVGIDSASYKIVTIPYSTNLKEQQIKADLQGTTVNIQSRQFLNGSFRQQFAYSNANKTNDEKRRIFERSLAADGYAKSAVERIEHSDLYDVDVPLQVNAAYRLTDFAVLTADMLYLKMFLNLPIHDYISTDKRTYEYEMEEYQEYVFTQQIVIPKGYQVEYIPENVMIEHPLFGFSATLTQKEEEIIVSVRYKTDFLILPREDYDQWNEMNRMAKEFSNQSIVFNKNSKYSNNNNN